MSWMLFKDTEFGYLCSLCLQIPALNEKRLLEGRFMKHLSHFLYRKQHKELMQGPPPRWQTVTQGKATSCKGCKRYKVQKKNTPSQSTHSNWLEPECSENYDLL